MSHGPSPSSERLGGQGRTLSQQVVTDVLSKIRSGRLSVGDTLPPQAALRDTYGVGSSVIRDAMQQLSALGIIDVRPRRGATILAVDPSIGVDPELASQLLADDALHQLYSLRRLVEVEVAGQAADNALSTSLARLESAHERFVSGRDDVSVAHVLDIAFHREVAQLSGNGVFLRVLDSIADALLVVRKRAVLLPGATQRAAVEHAEILDALRAGDATQARDAMHRHLDTALQTITGSTASRSGRGD